MKIRPVLADTGRALGSALNLLNAGWTATQAVPLPQGGGWTLPQQALAIFIEAPWEQLNKPYRLALALADEDRKSAYFVPGPDRGAPEARIERPIMVPPVPTAPNGTPGLTSFIQEMPLGTLWIPAPGRRYIWIVNAGDAQEEIGFWVMHRPQQPVVGGSGPGEVY